MGTTSRRNALDNAGPDCNGVCFIDAVHSSLGTPGIFQRNILMVSISIGNSKVTIIDAIKALDDSDRGNLIERPWLNSIKGGRN
jgi:hypothetical protein